MPHVIDRNCIEKSFSIKTRDANINYNKFIDMINSFKEELFSLGINNKNTVIIESEASVDFLALVFSCLEEGIKFYVLDGNTLDEYIEQSNADYVLTTGKPSNRKISVVKIKYHKQNLRINYIPKIKPIDISLATFTNGINCPSKNVIHTHKSVYVSAKLMSHLYFTNKDNVLVYDNFSDINYIVSVVLSSMMSGSTMVLVENDILKISNLLKKEKISILPLFDINSKKLLSEVFNLNSIMYVINGKTSISHELTKDLLNNGVDTILNVYGLSEALPPISVKEITKTSLNDYFDDKDLGELTGLCDVKSINGEILVKGKNTCLVTDDLKSYFDNDEFYYTGDAGEVVKNKIQIHDHKYFTVSDEYGNEAGSKEIVKFIKEILGPENIKFIHLIKVNNNLIMSVNGDKINIQPKLTTEYINSNIKMKFNLHRGIDYIFLEKLIPYKGDKPEFSYIRNKYKTYFSN